MSKVRKIFRYGDQLAVVIVTMLAILDMLKLQFIYRILVKEKELITLCNLLEWK